MWSDLDLNAENQLARLAPKLPTPSYYVFLVFEGVLHSVNIPFKKKKQIFLAL